MRLKVRFTDEANLDLSDIVSYLATESIRAAEWLADRIELESLELADAAYHYPLLPHRPESGIRRRVVARYNIFFRVRGDTVEILHILHSARDHERILFPED